MIRTLVSPAELADLERQHGARLSIVDCRFSLTDVNAGERAYDQAHLHGAVYAHLDRDLSGRVVPGVTGRHPLPEPQSLAARFTALGISNASTVVAYDDGNGAFAARLWWLLRWLGHDDVAVLDGGIARWRSDGYAVTSERPTIVPRGFHGSPRSHMLADASEVDALRQDPSARVFDSRGADRFRGENETIDPVAGHIPGARSLPFMDNVAEGRMRPLGELHARFQAALGDVPPTQAVVYCGSGVTACQNLLAAEHAGFSGMRLYSGSWSEWITDPSRPVARGE
jgi:thiosulfate/3-mercaptopyruvate sulfurtransferase